MTSGVFAQDVADLVRGDDGRNWRHNWADASRMWVSATDGGAQPQRPGLSFGVVDSEWTTPTGRSMRPEAGRRRVSSASTSSWAAASARRT